VWDDGRWRGLPPLGADTTADVCVIGLGATGLTLAGELARAGVEVVGVEAAAVGAGAAGRNGGLLLAGLADFHHRAAAALGREVATGWYRDTLAEIERIAAETPQAVRRTGSLRIAADPAEERDCEVQLATMQADGLPGEPYEGPEGRGLLFPADATVQPLLRCRTLARIATAAGARLFERSPAVELGPGRVRTPLGTVACATVVAAVDGGLEKLLPELAGRVRTARAQMLATAPEPAVRIPRPVYFRWGWDYWQQLPDGRVALGGGRDVGGAAEWSAEAATTPAVQAHLERLLRERLGVTAPVTHRWAGAIAFTTDRMPVDEEVRPGVFALGGYCGTGNVVGSLLARRLAGRIAGTRPPGWSP
jgi:gamma-glutamylputrescine oxidase